MSRIDFHVFLGSRLDGMGNTYSAYRQNLHVTFQDELQDIEKELGSFNYLRKGVNFDDGESTLNKAAYHSGKVN